MKTFKLFTILLFILILACSKSDDSSSDKGINVQNLVKTIDENPISGDAIGTLQAVGDGALSFAIASQTLAGALNINPGTGAITVANASLFDYETNPVISASISIIDASNSATATATFNLSDVDDIESFLSTSKALYTAAGNGEWVAITEAEYNVLANGLNDVNKVATTDAEYNPTTPLSLASGNLTIVNNNGVTMPANSFIFAIKYWALNDTASGIKVKQSSTNVSSGYSDLGGTFSSNNIGNNYYVIKGNSTSVSNVGYLAIFDPTASDIGSINISSQVMYELSDSSTLSTSNDNALVYYQGLSTTQKQW